MAEPSSAGDFTVRSVMGLLDGHAAWAGELPAPQVLPPELVEEGRAIPVARVQAMHEGKRRARARRNPLAGAPPLAELGPMQFDDPALEKYKDQIEKDLANFE